MFSEIIKLLGPKARDSETGLSGWFESQDHFYIDGFQMVKLSNLRALKFKTRIVCSEKKKKRFLRGFRNFRFPFPNFFASGHHLLPKKNENVGDRIFHRSCVHLLSSPVSSLGNKFSVGNVSGFGVRVEGVGVVVFLPSSNYNLDQLVKRAGTSDQCSLVALHSFVSW